MTPTFDTFEAAQEARGEDHQICGTYLGEKPVYFLMPSDASDGQIADRAFEVKNGRPPSEYERWLLEMAQAKAEVPA